MERPYSEIKVLLYLHYSFENYNYQKTDPFCSDLNELEEVYKDILTSKTSFQNMV